MIILKEQFRSLLNFGQNYFDNSDETGFLSDCPSLMLGIAICCIQHSQAMLERGGCELAHSFFHFIHCEPQCLFILINWSSCFVGGIPENALQEMESKFSADPKNKLAQNACFATNPKQLMRNHSNFNKQLHVFSYKVFP